MSAKNYLFTINNPTSDDRSLLDNVTGNMYRLSNDINYLVYQLEAGESGTPHFQGYIQFSKRKSISQVKRITGERAHLEVARGSPKKNDAYCSKDEGRLEETVRIGTMIGGQGKRTDISEFTDVARTRTIDEGELIDTYGELLAKYPRFVARVQSFYQQRRVPSFEPRPGWQSELVQILQSEPDARKVYWYYEETGNVGKSYFAKHYVYQENAGSTRRGYLVTGGRHSDIYYGYKMERVVFFDWARDNQDTFPYGVVENFKNGYFLSTKYETFSNYFEAPHIVTFSNFLPDQTKLSADRWIIKQL